MVLFFLTISSEINLVIMNLLLTKENPSLMNAIAIRTGLFMMFGFIIFFLIMYWMGYGSRGEFHLFNGVFQIFCLYRAIRTYYILNPDDILKGNYLYGVAQGLRISVIGVGGFALLMTLFLYWDTDLMNAIRLSSSMGDSLNPFTANLFILTEGLAIGLIVSYILTRLFEVASKMI